MARRRRSSNVDHGGGGGHDGGGMMRWLLTYADMITLLTAFFIMMYSMSVLNLNKFKQVAISVRSGFGGDLEGAGVFKDGGVVTMDNPNKIPNPGEPLSMVMKQLDQYIKKHRLQDRVTTRMEKRGLVVSLSSDELLFDLGRAEIRPEAKQVLDKMANVLRAIHNDVLVEGHTCDLPIATFLYPSNWELSTARATEVVRYMIETKGLDPKRIGAAGYADARPYLPNTSEKNRRYNRRVDIVVLSGEEAMIHRAQTAPEVGPPLAPKVEPVAPVETKPESPAHAGSH